MQVPSQELMTKDNVTIHVDAVAFYKVEDPLKVLCNIKDGEAAQVYPFCVALSLVLAPRIIDADLQICDTPRCEISCLAQRSTKYYTTGMKLGGMCSLLYAE